MPFRATSVTPVTSKVGQICRLYYILKIYLRCILGASWVSLAEFCQKLLCEHAILGHVRDPCDLKSRSITPIVELVRDLPKMQTSCEFGVPKYISSKVIVLTNSVRRTRTRTRTWTRTRTRTWTRRSKRTKNSKSSHR